VAECNILVEGISDQILLANASAALQKLGRPHLDLADVAIIPYSEEPVLRQLVAMARSYRARVVVLADTDQQGRRITQYCQREGIPHFTILPFAERTDGSASIEDLVGVEEYTTAVNDFYGEFDWFTQLDPAEVETERHDLSLGAFLEKQFCARFQRSFSKTALAVHIAERAPDLSGHVLQRFEALFSAILTAP